MSGVKDRSGGARENSGPKPALIDVPKTDDPLEFLLAVMNNQEAGARTRIEAAKAAAVLKRGPKGYVRKKDERAEEARETAQGILATPPAPRLKVVGS